MSGLLRANHLLPRVLATLVALATVAGVRPAGEHADLRGDEASDTQVSCCCGAGEQDAGEPWSPNHGGSRDEDSSPCGSRCDSCGLLCCAAPAIAAPREGFLPDELPCLFSPVFGVSGERAGEPDLPLQPPRS